MTALVLLLLALTPIEQIQAGARYVHVPIGIYELTETLSIPSGQTIVCEPGAEFVAAPGAFTAIEAPMILIRGSTVSIIGCAFRMDRDAYTQPPYPQSEFRHGIQLQGASNVRLLDVTVSLPGGDGVAIDPLVTGSHTEDRFPCQNIQIDRLTVRDAYRNGLSITSCVGCTVRDSVIERTVGVPPQAGLNVEPSHGGDRASGILIERLVSSGHGGSAYFVNMDRQTAASKPVSVEFKDCTSEAIANGHDLIRVVEYCSNNTNKPPGQVVWDSTVWKQPP
jgi:hypothetical protein